MEMATDPWAYKNVDTSIAGSASRILVATNQGLVLMDRSGSVLDEREIFETEISVSPDFPFQPPAGFSGPPFDPRVEYDPIHDRLWIVYAQEGGGQAHLHVAVSADSSPDDLDPESGEWHWYTGTASPTDPDVGAFNFKHSQIDPDLRFKGFVDHPTVSIDANYLYVMAHDVAPILADRRAAIVIFPLEHGSGLSMLEGKRPHETDLDIVQLRLLDPLPNDERILHFAVQEPHEEAAGVQFFICPKEPPFYGTGGPPLQYGGVQDHVRLGALYLDGGRLDVYLPRPAHPVHGVVLQFRDRQLRAGNTHHGDQRLGDSHRLQQDRQRRFGP